MSQERRHAISIEEAGGYLMIKELHIENFRCFKSTDLKGLGRINIIVGSNASGKTALLEAIRLAGAGTPQSALLLNQARGVVFATKPGYSTEGFQSAWSNLFFNHETDKTIYLKTVDSVPTTRTLRIAFDAKHSYTIAPVMGHTIPSNIIPLKFERAKSANKSVGYASVDAQGILSFQPALDELGPVMGFHSYSQIPSAQEIATSYSQLVYSGKEESILATLQKVFSFIKGLTILSLVQGQESVYILQNNSPVIIPAAMISAGVNKFLSMIIGISSHRLGVYLADEIDNGFYYKTLPDIWSTLLKLANESEGQVFASTHSWECLKAAIPTIRENVNAFTLIRTSRQQEPECTAEVFRGEDVLSAIESDIEVR